MALMTTTEVAEYLRIKERTVYDMAARRLIPCTRVTGKLLFPRKLIDRWIESRTDLPVSYDAAPPPIYAGSSDPLLEWALRESDSRLAVLATGSRDGMKRLGRGEVCVAGVHLLEPDSKEYNVPFIRREIPFPDVVAIRFADREQGLLVARGNPLGLAGIGDLRRPGTRVALRPEGSGSRVLFDCMLQQAGIETDTLTVASRTPRTETDLALQVADGQADCGLGVLALARRNGLDFIALGVREPFDLVMRRRDYFEPPVQRLLALMRSSGFAEYAASLGGYGLESAGTVVFNA